jgi:hypothetical protein
VSSSLRYELKLVSPARRLHEARSWLRLHPAGLRVAYPPRLVNSLYLDTSNMGALEANLRGLAVRNKVRLRWYGEELPVVTRPILELKHKDNMLGSKAQRALPCTLDLTRTWRELLATVREGAGPEWGPTLSATGYPVLLNRYRREYYVTADGAVRVTLDYDQVAYDQRLTGRPNLSAPLLLEDQLVIEVKADRDETARVREVVSSFPLPRSRNSKYVNGALAALL